MRKSANKQQSQAQKIQKTVASRNVTQVNSNINSGEAVTGFVIIEWKPFLWAPLRMKGNLSVSSCISHNTSACSSTKHYAALYTVEHCAAVCGSI